MSVKLLTEHHLESLSLKGGCTGSPQSPLVQMPHCWKSRVMAQILLFYVHPIACGAFVGVLSMCPFQFCNDLDEEERAGCFS